MSSKQHMTPSEAFVETLVAQGVKDVFGIVGSAFMDALDLFPAAGIRRADGARAGRGAHGRRLFAGDGPARRLHRAERSGHHQFRDGRGGGLLGAQPGGGDHARDRHVRHGPGRLPGNRATADLLAHHKYQAHVNRADRMAEFTAKAFDNAMAERGPAQLNIPRDYSMARSTWRFPSRAACVAVRAPRKTWRRRPGCWPRRASR